MAETGVLIGHSEQPERLLLNRANRHGLVTGATGTGKTVTLQILAQGFSDAGVPIFAADVKGDLSGISMIGTPDEKMLARAAAMKLELQPAAAPTVFWDLFGEAGHPIRATVSQMGPLLISRMLELNDVQEGVLSVVFRAADEEGLLLLDLKDLRAALAHAAENAKDLSIRYGKITPNTIATIQRGLLVLEDQGITNLFGEPALQLSDIMRTDTSGKGYINLLAANKLIVSPRLYATFLLWLMSELFEELPEIGDTEKPRPPLRSRPRPGIWRTSPVKACRRRAVQVVRIWVRLSPSPCCALSEARSDENWFAACSVGSWVPVVQRAVDGAEARRSRVNRNRVLDRPFRQRPASPGANALMPSLMISPNRSDLSVKLTNTGPVDMPATAAMCRILVSS